MERVFALDLQFHYKGLEFVVHPAAVQDESGLILADCGYPGQLFQLERQLELAGTSFHRVTKILITHHDHDHMGALSEIKERYPEVDIFCSAVQLPYVTGMKKSLRLCQAEMIFPNLPPEEKPAALEFQQFIASVKPVRDVLPLEPGAGIDCRCGIETVDTAGHMPGHMSFYIPGCKTLIAGDALVVEEGELRIAEPRYALDLKEALRAVERLCGYDIEKVICYHGGLFSGDVKDSLQRIVREN